MSSSESESETECAVKSILNDYVAPRKKIAERTTKDGIENVPPKAMTIPIPPKPLKLKKNAKRN